MARSKYTRAMFTQPDARIFKIKNPKLELHYYTRAGFYHVQIWKPGTIRTFDTLAARSTLKLKASLRDWIKQDKARSTRDNQPVKPEPKPVTNWNPAQIATAKPKQHTQRAAVYCTRSYQPLHAEKRGMIERAKRVLFGR